MTISRRSFLAAQAAAAGALVAPLTALGTIGAEPDGAVSRRAAAKRTVKTGGAEAIPIDGGKYKVWVKKVGSGPIHMLTLHGGPGVTHEYFECFEDFLPQAGVTFWYYDQLGSGFSDQPDDTSLWTVERFRDEVEQVRAALGLEQFYLFGQSWGGMLGIEYALKEQKHLKGLVISNMTASIPSYMAYADVLRSRFPKDTLEILAKYEAKGEYHAPAYEKAVFETLYAKHLCRLDPWPEPVERTFKHLNPKVYETMQGPNEFVVNGTFKDWDRWKDLSKIAVPTLVIGATYDTMSVDDIRKEGSLIPHSRVHICPNGSHLAMWDDQENYFHALLGFLKDVESGRFAPKRGAA
jgi:proline iminopeptidase